MACEAVATVIFVDRYNRPQDQLLDSSVITMKVLPLEQCPPPSFPTAGLLLSPWTSVWAFPLSLVIYCVAFCELPSASCFEAHPFDDLFAVSHGFLVLAVIPLDRCTISLSFFEAGSHRLSWP